MELSKKQFEKISRMVFSACGINLKEGKESLVRARLARRLRETGIKDPRAYIRLLEKDTKEMDRFLDEISTNHTFFFRESRHFEALDPSHKRIWCAASSSGEEAYSILIFCLEKGFSPKILATDLSIRMIETATAGVYPLDRVKRMPTHLFRKYFTKSANNHTGYARLIKEVRSRVVFKRFNLVHDPLPGCIFDVIFLRNVMIYFGRETKEKVVNRLCRVLRPGGLFIIGGSESLIGIRHGLRYIRPCIYEKPVA